MANSNFDIIVYGTVCLDAIWRLPYLPPAGSYVDILEEKTTVGGEAANTAIALAKWGVRVALVGNALGDDADGERLRALFQSESPEIDTRFITTSATAITPYCLCMATPDGHRTMIGKGFNEMECPPLDVSLAQNARLFTTDPNAWEAGVQACHVATQAGAGAIPMDFTRDPEVSRRAAINLTSSAHVAPNGSLTDFAHYATRLRNESGRTTIVTCGERGCFVAEEGSEDPAIQVPAYVLSEVVDSTGAGDTFRAGILYGQLQGWDILTTARFASAVAALNCTALGGWGGVRSLEEIAAFQKDTPTRN